MTRMSDHDPGKAPHLAAIPATSQGGSTLARPLHAWRSLVVIAALLPLFAAASGCVIPPSLSVENQDAGVNSPPAILAVRSDQQELPEPGPVTFERGTGMLTLTLLDTDVDDTLFVRIYVDYTVADPTPARATCTAPVNGATQRSASCDLAALCQVEDINTDRLMQVHVFDRQVLEAGTPAFKAMPPGGLTTSRIYQMTCEDMTL